MCGLHEVFEVTASSEEGCLNTLRLFSLGGELPLIFFFFSLKKSPQNWIVFSSFWGEQKCSPRFRTAKSYFCIDVRDGKWPMDAAPITKSKDKTQDRFCWRPKSPNQRAVELTYPLFGNVESKSSQDRNKPKNSVNCEHFIFGSGHPVSNDNRRFLKKTQFGWLIGRWPPG